MNNSLLKEYQKNGFVIVKNFFDDQEIKTLNKEVQNFLSTKALQLTGKDINFTKSKSVNTAHDVDKFDEYFKEFAKKRKIEKLVGFFLNSEIEFRKCEIFAKPAKVGMASPFHQDNFYWGVKNNNALTIWVALDKAGKENGGLSYYKGSHLFGVVDHEDSFAPGSSQKIKNNIIKKYSNLDIITPELNKGDILVHHSLTFHGSSRNLSDRNRRGFTMQFKDKYSEYDTKHLDHYNSRLNEQVKLRQNK